jgi:hypothetical protein
LRSKKCAQILTLDKRFLLFIIKDYGVVAVYFLKSGLKKVFPPESQGRLNRFFSGGNYKKWHEKLF